MPKMLYIALIVVIFFLSNPISVAYEKEIKSISSTLTENIAKAGKKMIAVVDFTDLQGDVTELGRFLAEEFSVAFAGAGKGFEVVDRTHLKSILAEHKLSATGLIDPQTARKLGQIAGVDALITGTVTPFGDSIRISVKILDTATAKVIGASAGDIPKTKAIEELLTREIEPSRPLKEQSIPSPPSYVTTGLKSKKVGEIIVTIKGINVSKSQVMVTLDFANQSDKEFKLAREQDEPYLSDEKSNIFRYTGRIANTTSFGWIGGKREWREYGILTLNPKSNNDVVLYFSPQERNIDIKDIGSVFAFSFNFALYNPKEKSESSYTISFTDVKGHRAR